MTLLCKRFSQPGIYKEQAIQILVSHSHCKAEFEDVFMHWFWHYIIWAALETCLFCLLFFKASCITLGIVPSFQAVGPFYCFESRMLKP